MSEQIKFVQGNEACVEGALYAGFAPFNITFGGRIRQHKPAGCVGTIGFQDFVRVDAVAFGFGNLFDRANGRGFAGLDLGRLPLAINGFDDDHHHDDDMVEMITCLTSNLA